MGIVLSCFALASNSIKKKDDHKKDNQKQKQPQPLPPQAVSDAHRGLQDEHLSTVPPPKPDSPSPANPEQSEQSEQVAAVATSTEEVRREVAPAVPVPTTDTDTPLDIRKLLSRSFSQQLELERESEGASGVRNSRMASDEDYAAFLDNANQDPSQGTANTKQKGGKMEFKTTEEGVTVPAGLKKAVKEKFYTSDADEPFVAVALRCEGMPDEATFAKLINHPSPSSAEVDIIDVGEWDAQGQYKDVVEAVRAAVKGGDVRVYRVVREGARVEYWVLGVEGGRLVGAKALAVES